MPLCTSCLKPYDQARMDLGYTRCLACSPNHNTYKAGIHYGHKTAGELDIMPAAQYNKYRKVINRIGKHSSNMSRTARQNTAYTV